MTPAPVSLSVRPAVVWDSTRYNLLKYNKSYQVEIGLRRTLDTVCYFVIGLPKMSKRKSPGDEIYPNVTSLYFAIPLLRLTLPTKGFPWNDLRKILHGGQKMGSVQNGEEILPKVLTPE